jgi:hypothetical protein
VFTKRGLQSDLDVPIVSKLFLVSWCAILALHCKGCERTSQAISCHQESQNPIINSNIPYHFQVYVEKRGIMRGIVVSSSRDLRRSVRHTHHVAISTSSFSAAPPVESSSSRPSLSPSSSSAPSYHDLSIQPTMRSLAIGSML